MELRLDQEGAFNVISAWRESVVPKEPFKKIENALIDRFVENAKKGEPDSVVSLGDKRSRTGEEMFPMMAMMSIWYFILGDTNNTTFVSVFENVNQHDGRITLEPSNMIKEALKVLAENK